MPKRAQSTAAKGGRKQIKEEEDYSLWEDIGNQLRIDSARAIRVTKSGHPTSSSSIADLLAVLFFHPRGIKFHANNPKHFLNDRLVLSKGHAAPALYAAYYRAGIFTEQQLMSLRLKGSLVEGHPVPKIPFVDVATGSLGQGLSVAAGMAYSSKFFDKIDNRVFCICGDGQVAEGSIWEAANFASFYKLNNLICFVDVNRMGQSQDTMFGHDLVAYESRFKTFGWNTVKIDGHSIKQIVNSIDNAFSEKNANKPTVVICKTEKGKGFTEAVEGKINWHGKDLGNEFDSSIELLKGLIKREEIEYKTYPPEGDQPVFNEPSVVVKPDYKPEDKISTRKAYGNGLLKAHESNNQVIGLDGDMRNSTFSITLYEKHPEAYVECFIAEQNMVGVATGLSCRKKLAFCSTFAAFFSRAGDQIRIAGISGSNIKIVGSHSGCSIGEDGPSQMGLQDLAFFRTLPNGVVVIPSDGVASERSVELVANYNYGPAFIRTARMDVPIIYPNDEEFELGKCKVVKSSENDSLVVIAASITVHEAIKAWGRLKEEGVNIRVVDIFSLKPLDEEGLRKNIEEVGGKVIVVEQHYPEGGIRDAVCGALYASIKHLAHLCVRKVPGSAKPQEQLELYEVDHNAIYAKAKELTQ